MAKVDVTAGMRAHRTVGAISLDVVTDQLLVDLDPDLTDLGKALTAALRQKVRAIRVTSEQTGKRLFNQAGRFVNTMFTRLDAPGQWSVRAILNRRAPDRVQQVYARLVELVPELVNPSLLGKDRGVVRAIERIVAGMVSVQKAAA